MSKIEMNVIGHLEELRKRILFSIGFFIIFFIISFLYVKDIYAWLVRDFPVKLAVLGPSDILWVYLMLACIVAIAGTIPVAALQIWLYVRPALHPHERKLTLAYIPFLFILFIGGISFGYFLIFPIVFNFLLSISEDMFLNFFTAQKYFSFLVNIVLPFGFLFEIPIVTMFLTSIGLINPYQLQKVRKYAYFILAVTSILITPPDFLSDVLVMIPLFFLYECSIMFSKIVYRKKMKNNSIQQTAI